MLHLPLLVINRLNKTEFAIFIPLMWSLLYWDLTNQYLCIFTAAGFVPCGGRKTSPLHHHSVYNIFWSFGIIELIFHHLKNRGPLKPVIGVGGGGGAVLQIPLLVMNRLNEKQLCYFQSFVVVLTSKGI